MAILRVRVASRVMVGVPVLNDKPWWDIVMLYVISKRCVAELYLLRYDASRLLVMVDDSRNKGFFRLYRFWVRTIGCVDRRFGDIVHVMLGYYLIAGCRIVGIGVGWWWCGFRCWAISITRDRDLCSVIVNDEYCLEHLLDQVRSDGLRP